MIAVVAWLGMAMAVAGLVELPYIALPLLAFAQGNASALFDVTAVCCVIENFPERRGQAIGLAKSFVGLSAAIFASFYSGWFAGNVTGFLAFIGLDYLLAGTVGALLLSRPHFAGVGLADDGHATAVDRRFAAGLYWILFLIVFLMGTSSFSDSLCASSRCTAYLADVTAAILGVGLLCLASPLRPAPRAAAAAAAAAARPSDASHDQYLYQSRDQPGEPHEHEHELLDKPLTAPPTAPTKSAASTKTQSAEPPAKPISLRRTVLLAALLFGGLTLSLGTGLMLIVNLSSMTASRTNDATASPAAFVSISSACNSAGRLGAGYASDLALYRYGIPRPIALAAAAAMLGVSMGGLVFSGLTPLYVACVVGGLSYGALNALVPPVTAEIFPISLLPILYALVGGCGYALGSVLLATLVYGTLFDRALARHGLEETQPCPYADCYLPSVWAAVVSSWTAAALFLAIARLTARVEYASYLQARRPQAHDLL